MELGLCARYGCEARVPSSRATFCCKRCAAHERGRSARSVDRSLTRRRPAPYRPEPRVQGDISEMEIDRRFEEGLRAVKASGMFTLDPLQRRGTVYDAEQFGSHES